MYSLKRIILAASPTVPTNTAIWLAGHNPVIKNLPSDWLADEHVFLSMV